MVGLVDLSPESDGDKQHNRLDKDILCFCLEYRPPGKRYLPREEHALTFAVHLRLYHCTRSCL